MPEKRNQLGATEQGFDIRRHWEVIQRLHWYTTAGTSGVKHPARVVTEGAFGTVRVLHGMFWRQVHTVPVRNTVVLTDLNAANQFGLKTLQDTLHSKTNKNSYYKIPSTFFDDTVYII